MKIIGIVDDKNSAQFRYRCRNVAEVLNGTDWEIRWFLKDEIIEVEKVLNDVDLVVIERQTDKDGRVGKFIKVVHDAGIKVVFDLDDLVFDYRDLPLLMKSTNSKNVFYWMGYFWGVRRIAKKVDGFIVTNEFLGEKIRKSLDKPYKVIRNSLNKEQIKVSDECVKNKKKHSGFMIGYFSGSPTHVKDFRMVESELVKFLDAHEDAKILVVGYMEFSNEMKKMMEWGRVEFVEPVGYLKLQELMAGVDVNIAPLVVNDFTNSKSELKFFEAAAVEVTTIASPTYTFKKAIRNGENGFLAWSGEWYEKLEYLYQHRVENERIAKQAKEDALKNYAGEVLRKEVEEAYECFAK